MDLDLLAQADPAMAAEIDATRLRAKVDERIGGSVRITSDSAMLGRKWSKLAVGFALVVAVLAPVVVLTRADDSPFPLLGLPGNLAGVATVIPLEGGGVKTTAVDGDTVWVMNALARSLQRIDVASRHVESSYPIDGYVEGVAVGGGYVWLAGYDDGGEVLRFDPAAGEVDLVIPTGSVPAIAWFGGHVWVSTEEGELQRVTAGGEVTSMGTGELKGEGLGYLWANDPETGLISSIARDGTRGQVVVPTRSGVETAGGWGVREVVEADGRLWLMDGMYPWGTNLSVFDPATGELRSFGALTFGLLSIVTFDGSLWVTSGADHLVLRIDPQTGQVRRYPLPGKPGGLVVAGDALWATLYQPGALVELDTEGAVEAGPIVADHWERYPHRLLCTGDGSAVGPTILLEPSDWIDYGSWSMVQAQLSGRGYVVCANGYVEGDSTPQQRAADLAEALTEYGIQGPYLLVAAGDGVHTIRIFSDGRDDVAGVVLVDPMPVGFQTLYDAALPGWGHPRWTDIDAALSGRLDGFGRVPLLVIGQDPERTFLHPGFRQGGCCDASGASRTGVSEEVARRLNDAWQAGLAFYAGLSADSTTVTAAGSAFDLILWEQPELVTDWVLQVARDGGAEG
jgi:sugar lactone lactonase YvrE